MWSTSAKAAATVCVSQLAQGNCFSKAMRRLVEGSQSVFAVACRPRAGMVHVLASCKASLSPLSQCSILLATALLLQSWVLCARTPCPQTYSLSCVQGTLT